MFRMPYWFQGKTNINPDDILQIAIDEKMEMVNFLFKRMLLIIRVSVMGIANKHKINTKSFTKAELIVANDAMQQMLLTCYSNQILRFYYQREFSFPNIIYSPCCLIGMGWHPGVNEPIISGWDNILSRTIFLLAIYWLSTVPPM